MRIFNFKPHFLRIDSKYLEEFDVFDLKSRLSGTAMNKIFILHKIIIFLYLLSLEGLMRLKIYQLFIIRYILCIIYYILYIVYIYNIYSFFRYINHAQEYM